MNSKMRFKILLIFFLTSCVSEVNQNTSRSTYTSSGFAYIYNESDYINKVTSKIVVLPIPVEG